MPKILQIGNEIIEYPAPEDRAGWGEEATRFAELVTEALLTVQGPNDLLTQSATLANNQIASANIPGFVFNTGQVQAINAEFLVIRVFDVGATTVVESGQINGSYNGTEFKITIESDGDTGVRFSITNGGQIQYTSDDKPNHISSVIRFKAKTIDQP